MTYFVSKIGCIMHLLFLIKMPLSLTYPTTFTGDTGLRGPIGETGTSGTKGDKGDQGT